MVHRYGMTQTNFLHGVVDLPKLFVRSQRNCCKLVLQMAGEDDKEQRECTFCLRLAVRAFSIMLINFIFCVLEQRAPTSLWIAESTQSMPYNAATLCSGFYLLDAIDRHRRQSYPRVI